MMHGQKNIKKCECFSYACYSSKFAATLTDVPTAA